MGANLVIAGALGSAPAAANTLTLAEPVGAQNGDLLIMTVTWRLNMVDQVDTLDAYWLEMGREENAPGASDTTSASASFVVGVQKRGASAPTAGQRTVTWGGATGGTVIGRIYAFRGVDSPLDLISIWRTLSSASTTVITNATNGGPDIDTNQDQAGLFMLCVNARNDGCSGQKANTDPTTGWIELTAEDFAGGVGHSMVAAYAVKSAVGNTGSFQWTAGSSALHSIFVLHFSSKLSVAVAPSPASAVGTRVMPSVLAGGLSITPDEAVARGQVVAPNAIHGSIAIMPAEAATIGLTISPTIGVGYEIASAAAEARGETSIEAILEALGPVFGPEDPITNFWTPEAELS